MKTLCVLVLVLSATMLCAMADIQVSYTGYSAEQQAAFEHAVSLWEPILNSTVPIQINATQQNLPGFVNIVIPNLIYNFAAAPQTEVWYPTALANAIAGMDLNPGEADFDLIMNPNQPWYLGLDTNCPANQIDYITEVHKGICYGLGYMSSFYISQGYGSYGMLNPSVLGLTPSFPWEAMQNHPALYDTHVMNTLGQYLCDTTAYTNPSTQLAAQLTGGDLRWIGATAVSFAGDNQPILFSGPFNLARTARLSGDVYNGTENAPGVPTAYNGALYRYPAPIVLGILADMGWDLDLSTLLAVPQDLGYFIEYEDVILTWNPVQTDFDLVSYQIYRDGALIASPNATTYTDLSVPPGTHTYYVTAQYHFGESAPSNTLNVTIGVPNDDPQGVPTAGINLESAPNPFRDRLEVAVDARLDGSLRVAVYDLRGRLVATLYDGHARRETLSLVWDGRGSGGRTAPSGIYLIRATGDGCVSTGKVLKLQ